MFAKCNTLERLKKEKTHTKKSKKKQFHNQQKRKLEWLPIFFFPSEYEVTKKKSK